MRDWKQLIAIMACCGITMFPKAWSRALSFASDWAFNQCLLGTSLPRFQTPGLTYCGRSCEEANNAKRRLGHGQLDMQVNLQQRLRSKWISSKSLFAKLGLAHRRKTRLRFISARQFSVIKSTLVPSVGTLVQWLSCVFQTSKAPDWKTTFRYRIAGPENVEASFVAFLPQTEFVTPHTKLWSLCPWK